MNDSIEPAKILRRIVVVGSLNLDMVIRVPTLPAPGETIIGNRFWNKPGGKGLNQALAVSALGAPVTLVGAVGDDQAASLLREAIRKGAVDDSAIVQVPGPSGVAMITVDEQGENTIAVASAANALLRPDHLGRLTELLQGADAVLIQLEIGLDCVAEAVRLANLSRVPVILNAAPVPTGDLQQLEALLPQVDVLVVNETEARALGVRTTDGHGAEQLLGLGVSRSVITLGGRGVVWADRDGHAQSAAFAVEVVSTIGAGDMFCAGLTVALARGSSLSEAISIASAASALVVARKSQDDPLPSWESATEFAMLHS